MAAWRNEFAATARLGLPLALTQAAHAGLQWMAHTQIARLGPDMLTGAGMGYQVYLVLFLVLSGVTLSLPPLLAQAMAAGRTHDCAMILRASLWTYLALGALGSLALLGVESFVYRAMGQTADNARIAQEYAYALMPVLWMALGFMVLRGIVSALDDALSVALTTPIGFLAALPFLPFVAGLWGLPALGLWAAGLAVFFAFLVMNVFLILRMARRPDIQAWRAHADGPARAAMKTIFWVGLPIGGALLFENLLFASSLFMVGNFGNVQASAHQIANTTTSFSFMIPLGLSAAVTIRVALAAGRKDRAGMGRALAAGLSLVMAFMLFMAAIYSFAPLWIVGLFVDPTDPSLGTVTAFAISFLGIAALYQIVDGLQVTMIGALRGLKDTQWPMWLAGGSYWLVGFPVAYWLAFEAGWEGRGVWWGLAAGLGMAGLLLSIRWALLTRRVGDGQETA